MRGLGIALAFFVVLTTLAPLASAGVDVDITSVCQKVPDRTFNVPVVNVQVDALEEPKDTCYNNRKIHIGGFDTP